MKIGIFGDSFAKHKHHHTDAWYDMLSKDYEVQNFAEPGTSLYYSVELYWQNYHNFDKNIFFITHPSRIMLPEHSYVVDPVTNRTIKCLTSRSAPELLERVYSSFDKKIVQSVIDYYLYLEHRQYGKYVHNLIVEDIKKVSTNTLFVDTMDLTKIMDLENAFFQLKSDYFNDYNDTRNCHLTYENNVILYNLVKTWISTSVFDFNIDNFQKDGFNFSEYFSRK